jgi:ubiquinone/menaquinone biosynthesis C-methylase UbiE
MKKTDVLIAFLFLLSFAINSHGQDGRIRFERQHVILDDFAADGYILAIGGGGEGTIGRLKGSQVIAVDILKSELLEAPDGPLKIIMDARDLKFIDKTFNTATAFFTLMYIDGNDHDKVFREVYRVLKPGGKFLIWDAIIPEPPDSTKNRVLVPLTIQLPQKEVRTGYGVRLPREKHDLAYYVKRAESVGFKVLSKKEKDRTFYLEIQK